MSSPSCLLAPLSSLALLAAGAAAAAPPALGSAAGETRAVRCLLVAPLENASDLPEAAATASQALVSFAGGARERLLSESELRSVFEGTSLELPDGVPPSLAVELAELLGADAVLYGAVEGRGQSLRPSLAVTLGLSLAGSRELLHIVTAPVVPAEGERPLVAVRRAAASAGREAMAFLGGPLPPNGCFDPEWLGRVRRVALSAGAPALPRAPHEASLGAGRAGFLPAAAPATARQAEWAWRLGARDRFVVNGVAFDGRTERLAVEAGLEDLAGALRAAPAVRIRLEGFVDASAHEDLDFRLSLAMAQAAGERLVELGVPRERLSWTGRGGDAPLAPNTSTWGRAGNRRIEAVPLAETAAHP
jgi:hypothetical protein